MIAFGFAFCITHELSLPGQHIPLFLQLPGDPTGISLAKSSSSSWPWTISGCKTKKSVGARIMDKYKCNHVPCPNIIQHQNYRLMKVQLIIKRGKPKTWQHQQSEILRQILTTPQTPVGSQICLLHQKQQPSSLQSLRSSEKPTP